MPGCGGGLRERNKSRTRRAIEDAAWALFADRGYEAVTLADVAERAGVGLRTVYRYFPHKDLLLDGDQPQVRAAVEAALAALPAGSPLSEVVRAGARAVVETKAADRGRELLRARMAEATPALAAREVARADGHTALLAAEIARRLGAQPGDFRAAVLAEAVTGALRTARRRWLADPTVDAAALVDEAVRVIAPVLDAA